MMSRRVFLKNGAFALVSLGFAPSFLARTAFAQGRPRAPNSSSRSSSAAPSTASASSCRSARRDYYRARPSIAIARPTVRRSRRARSRRLLRLQPAAAAAQAALGRRAQLAIVHACGSPDSTRSHFDAQDYMETRHARREEHAGRLAEPVPAGAGRCRAAATPFRAVALTHAAAAHAAGHGAGAGDEPDRAVRHPRRPGERRGGASFEAQYAAAADRVLNGTGREAFDAIKMLKAADPSRYQPDNGADYPRSPFGQALQADRAADEGRRRPRGRVRRRRRLGHARQPGRRRRVSSPPGSTISVARHRRARRPTSATAWRTPWS